MHNQVKCEPVIVSNASHVFGCPSEEMVELTQQVQSTLQCLHLHQQMPFQSRLGQDDETFQGECNRDTAA